MSGISGVLCLVCVFVAAWCYDGRPSSEFVSEHPRLTPGNVGKGGFVKTMSAGSSGRTGRVEVADGCDGFLSCLTANMLRNVTDIVRNDEFQLTDSLKFERNDIGDLNGSSTGLRSISPKKYRYRNKDLNTGLVRRTLDVFQTHSLIWSVCAGVDVKVFKERRQPLDVALEFPMEHIARTGVARTFGARKRIVMVLLPLMYKMGVMTTMLGGLIVLTLKGLVIGVILLILAFGNLFKKGFHHPGGHWTGGQDIHVHVHNDGHHQEAYHAWKPASAAYHDHYYRRSDLTQEPLPLPQDLGVYKQ